MFHKLIRFTTSMFLCLVFISASFFPTLAAATANDNFVNAEVIGSLPFSATVDITEATTEMNEPSACYWPSQTIWYSFTPSETIAVETDIIGSLAYAQVTVYQSVYDPGISGLQYIGCASGESKVKFTAQAGKTYYLQINGSVWNSSLVQVNLTEVSPPTNDDFENAALVPLPIPFDGFVDTTAATTQPGEPVPSSCSYWGIYKTVWYAFTADSNGSVTASIYNSWANDVLAVYSGSTLGDLTLLACGSNYPRMATIQTMPGITYYFQLGVMYEWESGGERYFHLEVTPPPTAALGYYPYDPSIYDTISFYSNSYDPVGAGFSRFDWDFGDGNTAEGYNSTHRYFADGDYQVTLKVTTVDGRTASITQAVTVRTHDVAITKVIAPKAASVGQTREIYVYLRNSHYLENVRLEVYKSVPGGMQWIDTLTLTVPVLGGNRLTTFSFRYSFTAQDAQIGKVSFQMVASIVDARDALPMDNTAISTPTRVSR